MTNKNIEEKRTGCFAWMIRMKRSVNERWARARNAFRKKFHADNGKTLKAEDLLNETGTPDMVITKVPVSPKTKTPTPTSPREQAIESANKASEDSPLQTSQKDVGVTTTTEKVVIASNGDGEPDNLEVRLYVEDLIEKVKQKYDAMAIVQEPATPPDDIPTVPVDIIASNGDGEPDKVIIGSNGDGQPDNLEVRLYVEDLIEKVKQKYDAMAIVQAPATPPDDIPTAPVDIIASNSDGEPDKVIIGSNGDGEPDNLEVRLYVEDLIDKVKQKYDAMAIVQAPATPPDDSPTVPVDIIASNGDGEPDKVIIGSNGDGQPDNLEVRLYVEDLIEKVKQKYDAMAIVQAPGTPPDDVPTVSVVKEDTVSLSSSIISDIATNTVRSSLTNVIEDLKNANNETTIDDTASLSSGAISVLADVAVTESLSKIMNEHDGNQSARTKTSTPRTVNELLERLDIDPNVGIMTSVSTGLPPCSP